MPKKASPAATKDDLKQFMGHVTSLIGDLENRMEHKVETLADQMEAWKIQVALHFDTVAENLKSDFRGALSDKIGQHEDRIVALEEHVGIRP